MSQSTFKGPVASQNGFLVGRADDVPANSPGIYSGTGAPTFAAAQASLYLRIDGSSTSTYGNCDGNTCPSAYSNCDCNTSAYSNCDCNTSTSTNGYCDCNTCTSTNGLRNKSF